MTKTDTLRGSRPIKPIGLKIIDHPKLTEWKECGQASQESDGLWLHYSVVCTLLKESGPTDAEIEELAREIFQFAISDDDTEFTVENLAAVLRGKLGGRDERDFAYGHIGRSSHPALPDGNLLVVDWAKSEEAMTNKNDTPPALLGRCDIKQYEHVGLHEQIMEHGQRLPPFPCENWKPDNPCMILEDRRESQPVSSRTEPPKMSAREFWGEFFGTHSDYADPTICKFAEAYAAAQSLSAQTPPEVIPQCSWCGKDSPWDHLCAACRGRMPKSPEITEHPELLAKAEGWRAAQIPPQGLRDNYNKFWEDLSRQGDPERIHNKIWVGYRAGWEAANRRNQEVASTVKAQP